MYRLRAQPATYRPAYRANRACVPGVPAYRAAYCVPGVPGATAVRTLYEYQPRGVPYVPRSVWCTPQATSRSYHPMGCVVHPPGDVT